MKRTIFTLVALLALTATYCIAQATSSSPSMSQTPSTSSTMPSSQSASAMPANGDNQQILSQVQQQLSADPALKGVQATIDAKNVVTLQGSVGSKADRKRAKSMVAAVPGVKKVEDNVTVSAASATPSAGSSTPAGTENTAGSIAGNTAASAGTTSGSSSTVGNSGASSATSQSCPGGSCGTTAADSNSAGMSSKGSADHQSDIQHAISEQITNSSITVQQSPTNIVLAGTVTTEADRVRAESIAKQYAAGMTVVNQINVSTSSSMASPSGSNSQSDANMAPAASGSSSMTPAAAGQSSASGSMSSTSSSSDMQSQIQNALQQQGLSGVMVNVTDTSIALSGTVASSKDRTTAKRIAQSYAGNRKVTENLTVSGSASPSSSTGSSGVGIAPSPNNSGPGNSPNPNAGSNSTSTTPPDQNNPH